MKNFRALLLALGAIFVSTQLAHANVQELTNKLTVLKDKLGELHETLTGKPAGGKKTGAGKENFKRLAKGVIGHMPKTFDDAQERSTKMVGVLRDDLIPQVEQAIAKLPIGPDVPFSPDDLKQAISDLDRAKSDLNAAVALDNKMSKEDFRKTIGDIRTQLVAGMNSADRALAIAELLIAENKFPDLMNEITTNETAGARNTLYKAQEDYKNAFIKCLNLGALSFDNMINKAIKWAVVAEAAQLETSTFGFNFSDKGKAKDTNATKYSNLVCNEQFAPAFKKLTKEEALAFVDVKPASTFAVASYSLKPDLQGFKDGIAYITMYGKANKFFTNPNRYINSGDADNAVDAAKTTLGKTIRDLWSDLK